MTILMLFQILLAELKKELVPNPNLALRRHFVPKVTPFLPFSTIGAVFGHFVQFNMAFTHINLGRGCSA